MREPGDIRALAQALTDALSAHGISCPPKISAEGRRRKPEMDLAVSLALAGDNFNRAAEKAGVSPNGLYCRLKKYGLLEKLPNYSPRPHKKNP